MASCTDEYKLLNAELDEVINYKHSFSQWVDSNPQAAYEAGVADEEINRIKKQLQALKDQARAAEELARTVGEKAASVAQDKLEEAAKAAEAAEVEAVKKTAAEAAEAAAGVTGTETEALKAFGAVELVLSLLGSHRDTAKQLIGPGLNTALKNVTDKLNIFETLKEKFNTLTGCGESGGVGGGKVKKSRKNKKSKNTRKNKKSKNSRKNSRKNRKN